MKKVVVAVWNKGGKGKSASLRGFAHLLISSYPRHTILFENPVPITTATGDLRLIIEINGKIIAIETQGDPNTNLRGRLSDIVTTYNPDIILCSCRVRGETVWAIEALASTPLSYDIIWTSTYQSDIGAMHATFNNLKAHHILHLLQSLSLL